MRSRTTSSSSTPSLKFIRRFNLSSIRTFSCSTESALLKILTGSNAEFPYLLFFSIRNSAIVSQWSLILLDAVFDMVNGFLNVV